MAVQEWSYIPVGGALPCTRQRHIAFGAAASMIHPATGYSISRSLTEAPQQARAISEALRGVKEGGGSEAPDCEAAAVEGAAWQHIHIAMASCFLFFFFFFFFFFPNFVNQIISIVFIIIFVPPPPLIPSMTQPGPICGHANASVNERS